MSRYQNNQGCLNAYAETLKGEPLQEFKDSITAEQEKQVITHLHSIEWLVNKQKAKKK